ncbi:MAG: hypothetical protein AAGD43_21555 [Pseudomonadota bacterium]
MQRLIPAVLVLIAAALVVSLLVANWSDISQWVQSEQRAMQTQLARAIQAVRSGDQFAVVTLLSACLLYGLLHAVGPGHGKFLIGGAAVASRRTAWRMATIGFSASLMQAVSAVVLAYGGLGLAAATGSAVIGSAEGLLMPISFAAMALVGVWIALRGYRMIRGQTSAQVHSHDVLEHAHHRAHDHGHDHVHSHDHADHAHHHHDHIHTHAHSGECAAGCKHMPTAEEAEKLETWRDVAALVLSIGIRPCSGALIVLIISWHFGLYLVGALGTVAMAVGTGVIVASVALFATNVRDSGLFRLSSSGDGISALSFGRLQILVGSLVVVVCLAFIFSGTPSAVPIGLTR